jgi:hypothetical protein
MLHLSREVGASPLRRFNAALPFSADWRGDADFKVMQLLFKTKFRMPATFDFERSHRPVQESASFPVAQRTNEVGLSRTFRSGCERPGPGISPLKRARSSKRQPRIIRHRHRLQHRGSAAIHSPPPVLQVHNEKCRGDDLLWLCAKVRTKPISDGGAEDSARAQ